jgi:hypothetical protein
MFVDRGILVVVRISDSNPWPQKNFPAAKECFPLAIG